MVKYFLMHKDHVCGTMIYDETTGRMVNYHDNKTGYSPFLGNPDTEKIKKWWEMRAIPASRSVVQNILKEAGCLNTGSYLAKNLAVSMTDSYWICPEDASVSYKDVNFSKFAMFHDGKVPYHNATSYDPNASLGGQMDKYWDLSNEHPMLIKKSYHSFGQQSLNEVFATRVHELQNTDIPFVKYFASMTEDRAILSMCESFTSERIEFIPAYEVVESQKLPNSIALYDAYIEICVENGIEREVIQNFMDYQTLTDFAISNTDEHLLNFGILRDADTMKIIGPAPIFDSGNSMFYSDERKVPYTRVGLLERKVTSFYDKEELLLKKIKNKNIIKVDLLPSPKTVKQFYAQSGIPEWKADIISQNYDLKIQMLNEFQRGKTISLYLEKQKEKAVQPIRRNSIQHAPEFIMMCGLPGSGKSEQAEKIKNDYLVQGYRYIDSKNLYSIEDADKEIGIVLDKEAILANVNPKPGYEKTITIISANEIRKELNLSYARYRNDLVFAIAEARIKTALVSGATVIYDASNLEKSARERVIGIVENAGVHSKELHVIQIQPEKSKSEIPLERLQAMNFRFKENAPTKEEGWLDIIVHDHAKGRSKDLDMER